MGAKRLRLPAALRPVAAALAAEAERRGTPAYAVGGCVRDWFLGRPTKDLDVVLESDPRPLASWCAARLRAKAEAFDRFGTVRVEAKDGLRLDFARARAESYLQPAALPVVRPASLVDDLSRRDFAINAMAARLTGASLGELVDPLGGLRDVEEGIVRVLHPASFRDDPTRLYRAARFACRFGFSLDAETDRLRREALEGRLPATLSRERLRGELWRVLEEKDPACALETVGDWGLAEYWHPRFTWPAGLAAARDPLERLALIGLAMGADGLEFVRSLRLERTRTQDVVAALEAARRKAVPREELPEVARRALKRSLKPPASALRPLLLDGRDLRKLGVPPGPEYSRRLEAAARAQWSGEFSTKAAALRWLRRSFTVPSRGR